MGGRASHAPVIGLKRSAELRRLWTCERQSLAETDAERKPWKNRNPKLKTSSWLVVMFKKKWLKFAIFKTVQTLFVIFKFQAWHLNSIFLEAETDVHPNHHKHRNILPQQLPQLQKPTPRRALMGETGMRGTEVLAAAPTRRESMGGKASQVSFWWSKPQDLVAENFHGMLSHQKIYHALN